MARAATTARAVAAPLRLAAARARAAPARWLLPALGVALAVALLGTAAGGGTVAGERAAARSVTELDAAGRTVRLTWSGGLPPGTDARGTQLLRGLTGAGQTRSVLFLPTSAQAGRTRHEVQVAAIAPLGRWVALRAGRLPRACTPRRCEVLAAGGGAVPTVVVRNGLRLVTVGRAVLRSTVPLGFVPAARSARDARGGGPRPLLLAGDPRAADAAPGLTGVFRTNGWSAPLATVPPSWDLPALRARLAAARARLSRATDEFALSAPDAALERAQARAHETRHRVTLVGAGAAALLVAFAVLAATAMRRDLADERARLDRRGARRSQLAILSVAEAAWPAVGGVLAGGLVAVASTALRARAADVPVGGVLTHGLLSPTGLTAAAGLAVGTTVLLALAARTWTPAAARIADVVALAAVGTLALALSRGGGAEEGDTLAALLPPLACLVAAVVVARLAVPLLRGTEVAARRAPTPVRLAALGLARAPSGPALTIAVVAVGCGLSCFAWAYRATLHRGDADRAAYAVPLDVTVATGPDFLSPLQLAPAARWRALADGGPVLPVQRATAGVPRGATAVALPLLGVPAGGLRAIRRWRDADASAPRAALAERLRLPGTLAPRGTPVSPGDRTITARAAARGDALDLAALLQGPAGDVLRVPLGTARATARRLTVALPTGAAGRRLVGVEATLGSGVVATSGHQEAERAAAPLIERGVLEFGDLRVGAQPVAVAGWVGQGPLRPPVATGGRRLTVPYAFDRAGRALLTPRQPGAGRVLPVVTDRRTAASAGPRGLLPLTVDGERLTARVVGTVARFPTVPGSADGVVVADGASLAAVLQPRAPGVVRPAELWIGASPAAEKRLRAALREPPLGGLAVASRRTGERTLRTDPLARELVATLVAAAIVALALAALGVLVAVALALRDDAADLYDLEALGVAPSVLRADVRMRAAVLAGLGLAAGAAVGVGLTRLTVDAVQVTAAGARAVPPLVAVTPWGAWGLTALALAAAVAGGVAALTRRALAGPAPRRTPGGPG